MSDRTTNSLLIVLAILALTLPLWLPRLKREIDPPPPPKPPPKKPILPRPKPPR